jgi:hypothetical protein
MTDERHGVPSASYMRRIANCPPSFKLGQLYPDPGSNDASTGDKIHAALERWGEHGSEDGLSIEDIQTAEMCIDQRNELLDNWIGDEQNYQVYKETRLVMTPLGKVFDDSPDLKVKVVFSGKADYVAVFGEGALVVDYKTLHGEHDHAAVNDQLRALAVLVSLRHGVSQVRVAIVQPWKGKPTVADFNKVALIDARNWLVDRLHRERQSTPDQANPGDWCKFCPARVNCPAFTGPALATAETAIMQISSMDDETARKALFARAAELPDRELAARYKGLKWLGWYINAVEGNVRMRAKVGGEFAANYFRIVEGKPKETIADVSVVWSHLEKLGVSAEDFTRECKTTKKAVNALVRKATSMKGKALEGEVKRCLEGAVKLGAPPKKLAPVGGVIEDSEEVEDNE